MSDLLLCSLSPMAADPPFSLSDTVPIPLPPPPPISKPATHYNHPPYSEMILSAIKTLNEKKGSSRKAIAKFIAAAYPNLPPAHSALLTVHLRRMKQKGHVVMLKHSYKLPKPPSLAVAAVPAEKRGRGRPPKLIVAAAGAVVPVAPARGRGRPRKAVGAAGAQLRKRGRPSKPRADGELVVVATARPLRARGRPPKVAGDAAAKRPRGRPRKAEVAGGAAPKRRGRPAKVGGASSGRPRGRPKKAKAVEGALVVKKMGSGRPVGRPRKIPFPLLESVVQIQ